jgi:hypothetical protein
MTTTLTDHIVIVPAHLVPFIIDDLGINDVHAVTPLPAKQQHHIETADEMQPGDVFIGPDAFSGYIVERKNSATHERATMTITGYDFNDDGEISVIRWQTWNGTMTVIPEDIAPDTTLTLWLPTIPDALAAELV